MTVKTKTDEIVQTKTPKGRLTLEELDLEEDLEEDSAENGTGGNGGNEDENVLGESIGCQISV